MLKKDLLNICQQRPGAEVYFWLLDKYEHRAYIRLSAYKVLPYYTNGYALALFGPSVSFADSHESYKPLKGAQLIGMMQDAKRKDVHFFVNDKLIVPEMNDKSDFKHLLTSNGLYVHVFIPDQTTVINKFASQDNG